MTGISIEGAGGYWPPRRVPALPADQLVHTVYLPAAVVAAQRARAARAAQAAAVVSALGAVVSIDPAPTRPRGIPTTPTVPTLPIAPRMATAPRPAEVTTRTPWDDLLHGRTHALDRHTVTITIGPDPAADPDVDAVLVDLVTWMTLPGWQQLVVRTPDGPLYVRLPDRARPASTSGGAR